MIYQHILESKVCIITKHNTYSTCKNVNGVIYIFCKDNFPIKTKKPCNYNCKCPTQPTEFRVLCLLLCFSNYWLVEVWYLI